MISVCSYNLGCRIMFPSRICSIVLY